jgi:hypothetical protein
MKSQLFGQHKKTFEPYRCFWIISKKSTILNVFLNFWCFCGFLFDFGKKQTKKEKTTKLEFLFVSKFTILESCALCICVCVFVLFFPLRISTTCFFGSFFLFLLFVVQFVGFVVCVLCCLYFVFVVRFLYTSRTKLFFVFCAFCVFSICVFPSMDLCPGFPHQWACVRYYF